MSNYFNRDLTAPLKLGYEYKEKKDVITENVINKNKEKSNEKSNENKTQNLNDYSKELSIFTPQMVNNFKNPANWVSEEEKKNTYVEYGKKGWTMPKTTYKYAPKSSEYNFMLENPELYKHMLGPEVVREDLYGTSKDIIVSPDGKKQGNIYKLAYDLKISKMSDKDMEDAISYWTDIKDKADHMYETTKEEKYKNIVDMATYKKKEFSGYIATKKANFKTDRDEEAKKIFETDANLYNPNGPIIQRHNKYYIEQRKKYIQKGKNVAGNPTNLILEETGGRFDFNSPFAGKDGDPLNENEKEYINFLYGYFDEEEALKRTMLFLNDRMNGIMSDELSKNWFGSNVVAPGLGILGNLSGGLITAGEGVYTKIKNAINDEQTAISANSVGRSSLDTAAAMKKAFVGDSKGVEYYIREGLFGVGQSGAALLASGGNPAVASAIMGASTMGQTIDEQLDKGISFNKAFDFGVVSGAIETATEKIPLDNVVDAFKGVKYASKAAAKVGIRSKIVKAIKTGTIFIGKHSGTEAIEESVSNISNVFADILINGEESEYRKFVKTEMENGASYDEAIKKANKTFLVDNTITSAIIGGISGLFLGVVSSSIGAVSNTTKNSLTDLEKQQIQKVIDKIDSYDGRDANAQYYFGGTTKGGTRKYYSDFGDDVSQEERVEFFKKRIATIFNLGGVTLNTDTKKIVVKGDRFTKQKNVYGDYEKGNPNYDAKINALYDLADILSTSTFQGKEIEESYKNSNIPPENKAHKDVKYWYKFTNRIYLDGYLYDVTFNIRDKGKEQFEYLIEFKDLSKKMHLDSNTTHKESPAIFQNASYNNNIPQKGAVVNSNNMQNGKKNANFNNVYFYSGGVLSRGGEKANIGNAHEQARAKGKQLNNVEAAEAVKGHNNFKNSINAEARKVLTFATRLTDCNIFVSDAFADENSNPNGFFDRGNNAIVLNFKKIQDSKYVLNAVLTHEITHFAESSIYYNSLSDFILQESFGDVTTEEGKARLEQAIQDKLNEYKANGHELKNDNEAKTEIVAEKLAEILSNPEANKKAIFDLANQDLDTAKDFTSWLKAKIKNIKETLSKFGGYYSKHTDLTTYDKALNLFEKAVKDAKKNGTKFDQTGVNDINYYIRKDFSSNYDKWVERGRPNREKIEIGSTSEALKSINVKDQKITWDTSKINNSLDSHKYLNDNILKQIPNILEHPIIIMQSKKSDSRLTMFGEVYDSDGLPIMAVLELLPTNQKGTVVLDEIKVVSSHSRKDEDAPDSIAQTQGMIDSSEILYVEPNKKRTSTWLVANRLQLPLAITEYGPIKTITYPNEYVNSNNMQNENNYAYQDEYVPNSAMADALRKAGLLTDDEASFTDYSALMEAERNAEKKFETVKEQRYYDRAINTFWRDISKALGIHNLKMDEAVNKRLNDISQKYLETREFAQSDAEALFDGIYKNSEFASSETVVEDKKTFDKFFKDFTDKLDTLYRFQEGRLGKSEIELPEVDWESEIKKTESDIVKNDNYQIVEKKLLKLYDDKKLAQKNYEKAEKQILLSDKDKVHLDRLVKGEIEKADIPKNANKDGIMALYSYKSAVNDFNNKIRQYNAVRKERLDSRAKTVTENSDSWKDKKTGIAYSRETMERNIYDIVRNQEEAATVIEEYFTPVHINEANRKRDKNKYRGIVKGLNLKRHTEKGNSHSESYAVQFLGEINGDIETLEKRYNLSPEAISLLKKQAHNEIISENKKIAKTENNNKSQENSTKTKRQYEEKLIELYKQLEEFKALNPKLNYNKINDAIQVFRGVYDELFEQMNLVRVKNGYAPVDYKKSYFPHFINAEPEGIINKFARAIGINTDVTELPTNIAGRTHAFKPGITFSGHILRRKGTLTEYDALEGFDKYIESISDVIHHTDDLQRLRSLERAIRNKYSDEGVLKELEALRNDNTLDAEDKERRIDELKSRNISQLNNFIQELTEYTNILANKKNDADRKWERGFGRGVYNFFNGINKNVALNMVGGNLSSAFTNFIPLTQAKAECSTKSLLKAGAETVRNYVNEDGMVNNSSFLTNRLVGENYLVEKASDKMSNILMKPMEFIDNFTSQVIWRAKYLDGIDKGHSIEKAIMDADKFAAKVLADRSKGALPTVFSVKNPFTKSLTMFQVEVNNQLSYLFKDVPRSVKKKRELAASLMWYFLGAYLFNDLYELLMGRRPALDLIGSVNKVTGSATGKKLPNTFKVLSMYMNGEPLFDAKKKDKFGVASDVAKNVTENIPFVGGLVGGGRIPISSGIPFMEKPKELFDLFEGDVSPKKKDQILKEEIPKLAYNLWPYGGASQIMKSIKGVSAVAQGGKYIYDNEGNKKLQYPVHNETPLGTAGNYAKAALFGRNALQTAQDWVDNGFNTMGVKDTKRFDMLRDNDVKSSYAYDTINEISNLEEKTFKKYYEYIRDTELSKNSKADLQATYLSEKTDEKRLKAKQQGIDNKTFVDTYYNLSYNENLYDILDKHDKEALIRENEKESSSKLERAYILRIAGLTPKEKLELDKLLISEDTKMTEESYKSEGMFYYSLLTDAKKKRGAQMNKVFGFDARTYYYLVNELSGCKKKEEKIQKLKELGFNDYSANVWYNIVYK